MRLRGGLETVDGEIYVGQFGVGELAEQYGTPLYVYNGTYIRQQCAAVTKALSSYEGKSGAYFASKTFPNAAVEKLVSTLGLGVDVASEGELRVALLAGVPMELVTIHGLNKSPSYLRLAFEQKAGMLVIDSLEEIEQVDQMAAEFGHVMPVLIRINPGIEAETIKAVRTASPDSKFGIPLRGDLAAQAVTRVLACKHLDLRGIHCHIGSQILRMDAYELAAQTMLTFMQTARRLGSDMDVLNLGGGFGCWYSRGDTPMPLGECVDMIVKAVTSGALALGLPLPHLMLEPGRAIVAESAIALYTVGVVKEIPGVNHYAIIDGGLFDNPRPLFYGSRYTAFPACNMDAKPERYYTVSGLTCETDTQITRVKLPRLQPGDLLAFVSSGAYQLAMSSNYQRMPKSAAILVDQGQHALIQRRQTIDEVLALDCIPDFL